ncbi:type III secretion system effector protein [Kosakonia sp. BYX6]|uniref:Type III secretion system effector protein n=1 Tax=Kosakonia calanthes TaxID=3139408 RepID=A0ABZ3B6M2_9ENTR
MELNRIDLHMACAFVAANPTDTPETRNDVFPESMLAIFDDIWSKLLLLAKQLRDIMQFYNQKKQELGWSLEVNTLHSKMQAIDKSYVASELGAIGSIVGGTVMLGLGLQGGESGALLGQSIGQTSSGIFNWSASSETRQSDQQRSIADLQDKGAQAYAKTLNETLEKARDIMQQMMSLGRNLLEVVSQMLRASSR